MTIKILFTLLGSLALLIFGMKTMSDALQKMAGPKLRHVLARMTTNRFTGMLTGMGVTAVVQSSTATTVMTVSFVNASLLTLAQAISIIMGANIGTTLTAWIMSAGFSFNITNFVWPVFVLAMFLIYKKKHETVGCFLFGVAFLFLGLGTLRQTGIDMNLGENETMLSFFSSFDPDSIVTTLLFLLIGGILTMCVQSSAAVMAITMILCSSGALPIYQGIALVMGENIGTTVTSNLAALTASVQARRAAFAHMFFNVFGVCWMLCMFHPFVNFICSLAGYDTGMDRAAVSHDEFMANAARLSIVLATFHTCFNIVNTMLLIGFIPQMERIVKWVIKDKPQQAKSISRLQYINNGLMATPEISVLQAQKEVIHFAERMQRMFGMTRALLDEKDKKEFTQQYERIEKYEEIADNMELEIANYLEEVSNEHLSEDTKGKIRDMLREIGELESIGDACYKMARSIYHRQESREDFTTQQYVHLHEMLRLVNEAMTQMMVVVCGRREDLTIDTSQEIEHDINVLRDQLKAESIHEAGNHNYSYALGAIYSDIVAECEKLGDYIMNVVEARLGKRFLKFQGLQVNLDRKTVTIDGQPASLTRTEFGLLCLLLRSRGQVLSRQQLMENIWQDVIVTDRTVDVHITRLRKKLGPYASHIVSRQGFGYLFEMEKEHL
ncbi:MAG: Na/Pi symporter [Bacteroidaceae bacterium]|nr:Na/Pi symporter [Bacteroidaceae bacterium]